MSLAIEFDNVPPWYDRAVKGSALCVSIIYHVTYSEPLLISSRLKALAKPVARRAKERRAEDAWKATIVDERNAQRHAQCIIRRVRSVGGGMPVCKKDVERRTKGE